MAERAGRVQGAGCREQLTGEVGARMARHDFVVPDGNRSACELNGKHFRFCTLGAAEFAGSVRSIGGTGFADRSWKTFHAKEIRHVRIAGKAQLSAPGV